MSRPLFRPEVAQARQRGALGTISLSQPPSMIWMAVPLAVVAIAVIVFLTFGEYTRRTSVGGRLVPDLGLSVVVSPVSGVVSRLVPQEGTSVNKGDGLVLVEVPRSGPSGNDSWEGIRAGMDHRRDSIERQSRSQTEQIDAQEAGQKLQLDRTRQELKQIQTELATRTEQVRLAQETVDRYRSLSKTQYVSELQLHEQQLRALDSLNAKQALEREKLGVLRNIDQLEQSMRELPAQREGELARSEGDLAQLEQERIEQQSSGQLLLKAPVEGLVANRLVEPGQAVTAGQPLLTLLPRGSLLQAELLVPSRAIGFIEPGDRVLLRYQAYPFQKFGHHAGKVLRVSRSPVKVGPVEATDSNATTSESYYRVLVVLDRQRLDIYGKQEPLMPGMLLEADILAERRKLYEWLFEPLYSLRQKAS